MRKAHKYIICELLFIFVIYVNEKEKPHFL